MSYAVRFLGTLSPSLKGFAQSSQGNSSDLSSIMAAAAAGYGKAITMAKAIIMATLLWPSDRAGLLVITTRDCQIKDTDVAIVINISPRFITGIAA